MQEILFKAKRIDNGEWVKGYFVFIGDSACIICEAITSCMDGENTDLYAREWYEIDIDTICQYTGVTDKNGNMIWENDIGHYHGTHDDICVIRYGEYENNTRSKHIGFYTSWQTYDFMFRQDLGFWTDEREIEIIGNVFDNPELL